jgi:hypothetical protein
MKIFGLLLAVIPAMIMATLFSVPANAQATRTWVSGVGDDANPCSRTAPCKTFAGAISKTAAGGEINVLDPGGFGAVTITKSIQSSRSSRPASWYPGRMALSSASGRPTRSSLKVSISRGWGRVLMGSR